MESSEMPSYIDELKQEIKQDSVDKEPPKDGSVPSTDITTDTIDGPLSLSDGWQINQTLGQSMLNMFDAQLWTDVTFRCADQAKENLDDRIHAHKKVLAARSQVFETMFFGPYQNDNGEIEIQDTESGAFKMFLRSVYSDDLDLYDEFDDLLSIFNLANKYQLQVTIDKCCCKLVEKVSIKNAAALLERAMLFKNDDLMKRVSEFIDRNAEKILATDGFLDISLQCLTYILKGDTFYACEADIFNRSVEWAKKRCGSTDGQVIRQTLGDAFYYLRTPSMTLSDFVNCVKKRKFYNLDEYEEITDGIAHPGKSELVIECNLKRPRRSQAIVFKRLKPGNSETSSYRINEHCTIKPIEDVHLISICLKELLASTGLSKEDVALGLIPLKVKVSINDGDIYGSTHTINPGEDASNIQLQQAVLLRSGETFNLKVTASPDAAKLSVQLKTHKNEKGDKFVCNGFQVVSAVAEMDDFQVVENLTFECKSNRN